MSTVLHGPSFFGFVLAAAVLAAVAAPILSAVLGSKVLGVVLAVGGALVFLVAALLWSAHRALASRR